MTSTRGWTVRPRGGPAVAGFDHGHRDGSVRVTVYDAAGNRTYRDNLTNAAFGEVYTYDALDQLASFARGTLNGTKTGLTGTAARTKLGITTRWGNFDSVSTDGPRRPAPRTRRTRSRASRVRPRHLRQQREHDGGRDRAPVRVRCVEPARRGQEQRRHHAQDV